MTRGTEPLISEQIVDVIIKDLCDRKGLGDEWDMIDREIQVEIRAEWRRLVRGVLHGEDS